MSFKVDKCNIALDRNYIADCFCLYLHRKHVLSYSHTKGVFTIQTGRLPVRYFECILTHVNVKEYYREKGYTCYIFNRDRSLLKGLFVSKMHIQCLTYIVLWCIEHRLSSSRLSHVMFTSTRPSTYYTEVDEIYLYCIVRRSRH